MEPTADPGISPIGSSGGRMTDTVASPGPALAEMPPQPIIARSRARNAHKLADLEDFFENGAVALHLVGPDGIILRANRAELDMLGYAAEDYIGHHIGEFHADQAAIADILARLSRGEKIDRYPSRL